MTITEYLPISGIIPLLSPSRLEEKETLAVFSINVTRSKYKIPGSWDKETKLIWDKYPVYAVDANGNHIEKAASNKLSRIYTHLLIQMAEGLGKPINLKDFQAEALKGLKDKIFKLSKTCGFNDQIKKGINTEDYDYDVAAFVTDALNAIGWQDLKDRETPRKMETKETFDFPKKETKEAIDTFRRFKDFATVVTDKESINQLHEAAVASARGWIRKDLRAAGCEAVGLVVDCRNTMDLQKLVAFGIQYKIDWKLFSKSSRNINDYFKPTDGRKFLPVITLINPHLLPVPETALKSRIDESIFWLDVVDPEWFEKNNLQTLPQIIHYLSDSNTINTAVNTEYLSEHYKNVMEARQRDEKSRVIFEEPNEDDEENGSGEDEFDEEDEDDLVRERKPPFDNVLLNRTIHEGVWDFKEYDEDVHDLKIDISVEVSAGNFSLKYYNLISRFSNEDNYSIPCKKFLPSMIKETTN